MQSEIAGFRNADGPTVSIPVEFAGLLLAEVDDLAELKLTLFFLWALQQKDGNHRYLRYDEFRANADLMRGICGETQAGSCKSALDDAIDKAVARGTLLEAKIKRDGRMQRFFSLNDEHGRGIYDQLVSGRWQPATSGEIELLPVRPTLFGLYEANIGALTPMIAESIKEAEATYPSDWIEDAMRYAVERNARNWRYIRKVLDNWLREGRPSENAGRNLERHKRLRTRKR